MNLASKYIWMNGSLVEFEKATVHFLSPSLHYGIGVFEGIRCYDTEKGPAVFRLRDHMERFMDSSMILGFRSLPYSVDELTDGGQTDRPRKWLQRMLYPPAGLLRP